MRGHVQAFLEMSVHLHGLHFNPVAKGLLHLFSTVCICANIFVVSIITFVSVWGSGKALRGKDGSMSMVVEGMNKERWLIFKSFGVGLLSLLIAVACSTWLLMTREVALLATVLLLATCYALVSHALRIFKSARRSRHQPSPRQLLRAIAVGRSLPQRGLPLPKLSSPRPLPPPAVARAQSSSCRPARWCALATFCVRCPRRRRHRTRSLTRRR